MKNIKRLFSIEIGVTGHHGTYLNPPLHSNHNNIYLSENMEERDLYAPHQVQIIDRCQRQVACALKLNNRKEGPFAKISQRSE